MRKAFIYTVIFGMAIMLVPKTVMHDCQGHLHSDHSHELDSQINSDNGLSYEASDCEKCHYAFHALDLPEFSIIRVPVNFCEALPNVGFHAVTLGRIFNRTKRGPPQSLRKYQA
jgi:hypothetical protein